MDLFQVDDGGRLFISPAIEDWETLNIDFKLYPCGHVSHPYMDCARDLRARYKLTSDDVASIELLVSGHRRRGVPT